MRLFKILFVFFIPFLSFGNTTVKEVTLKWEASHKVKNALGEFDYIMSFDGAYYDNKYDNLPVFIYSFPLKYNNDIVEVSLENKVFTQLTEIEISALADKNFISQDVDVNAFNTIDRKKAFSKVTVLPFRRNPENGNIEKLLSFNIKTSIQKSNEKFTFNNVEQTNESVLAYGDWYKLRVSKTGVYKISYNDLLEMGVDVNSLNPQNISIFGNGNEMLSERNSDERPDDLIENAIFVSGEEDGSFDEGDFILFYGEDAVRWSYNPFKLTFNHFTNLYSDYTYYYLTTNTGNAKRIEEINTSLLQANKFADSYNDFVLHELESTSLINSGKEWFGESFSDSDMHDFNFDISDIDINSEARMEVGYAIQSQDTSTFSVFCNDEYIGYQHLNPSLGTSIFAHSGQESFEFYPLSNSNIEISLRFNPVANNSILWLDFLEINFMRHLNWNQAQMDFRNINSFGNGNNTEFSIAGVSSQLHIWDITNKYEIKSIVSGIIQNDTFRFVSETDSLHHFIAFDGSSFFQAEFVEKLENQNLHSYNPVDLIIVSYKEFLPFAENLASFHAEFDDLSSVTVSTDQIFNEFSSGIPDPSGIRDFVKMLYDRADSSNLPRYLLLFGDGNFDPKNRSGSFENYVPAYQSNESLKITATYVTDDFYGLMDYGEGYDAVGTLDIGIGRLSVSSTEQAEDIIQKIYNYSGKQESVHGSWRNKICFIADDQDNNLHVKQAEVLTTIVDTSNTIYNIEKIYLDAYQQITVPSGKRYPEVTKEINETVDQGALVINYTGHGGELGWAKEKIIDIPLINSWDNSDKLPVFVTATCEFTRFDNPELLSGGEVLFLNPKGGAIALYTTTRLAYSQTNFNLNKKFYSNFFNKENGEYNRLGDLMRLSKTPSNSNIRNFVLLGDPALEISFPDYGISTTSIIKDNAKSENDTINAKDKITISGYINNNNGNKVSSFNGIIETKLFDKIVENITLGNDPDSHPKTFDVRDIVLNQCKASVVNGDFNFSFYVPNDINFDFGNGKISYYAYDTVTYEDANGYEDVIIGDINNAVSDNTGPEIELYLNDKTFVSGDIVNKESVLYADFYDEQGINFTGNGIGHDIVAVIDDNYPASIVLNKYYEADVDDYRSGKLSFELDELSFGYHKIDLRAWDLFNNSSEVTIDFYVDGNSLYGLSNIKNFPNPFNNGTYFKFEHTFEDDILDVQIIILNTYGKIVKTINEETLPSTGYYGTPPVYWDGKNENGKLVKSGVYVYKILLTDKKANVVAGNGKLVIIR